MISVCCFDPSNIATDAAQIRLSFVAVLLSHQSFCIVEEGVYEEKTKGCNSKTVTDAVFHRIQCLHFPV